MAKKYMVDNRSDIIANIQTLKQYSGGTSKQRAFHDSLIKNGKHFVALHDSGAWTFAPSRFLGYKQTDMESHNSSMSKDGRDTSPLISKILKQARQGVGDPDFEIVESSFLEYCGGRGVVPKKYGKGRQYWVLKNTSAFQDAFIHFKKLIFKASGHEFTNFNEGRAAVWESYKPKLREHALSVLGVDDWNEETIGKGEILDKAIQAIELQSSNSTHTNNLVFWQNRYGHANRAHKSFIDAKDDKRLCQRIENALYDLFKRDNDEQAFRALNEISEGKYPLIAYLFFLKNMHTYVPILPTVYDKAFQALNINLVTLRNCSWENYVSYNRALGEVAQFLKGVVDQDGLNLIDAHSFCYLLIKTEDELEDGKLVAGKKDDGVILGEQDRRIWEMKDTVQKTVSSSNGQMEERTVKAKDLNMSDEQLMAEIKRLMNRQEHRCALTGLQLDYADKPVDVQMKPSLDRIDSDGHYELGNLQVVCRFINFWKSNQNNDEFLRLLDVVRER